MTSRTRNLVSQARLAELFRYYEESGFFTRLRSCGPQPKGVIAGHKTAEGYIEIYVDSIGYLAHRLVWLYMTGEWPSAFIDHINGDRADNSWANLRVVSKQVNAQNRRAAHINNSTSLLGVSRKNAKFTAQISDAQGRRRYLGIFDSAEQAHEAYISAKRKLHEGCTI